MEPSRFWSKTCAVFRTDASEDVADLWLAQLRPLAFDGETLFLTGPDRARAWVELRYARALTAAASRALGRDAEITFVDEHDARQLPPQAGAAAAAPATRPDCTPLNPRYTFEQFVIGASNRLAHAAALAVAEQPAQAFNPLFLYGTPGVGKTHLLHAIGNYLRREAPELNVTYMTAEDFAHTFRSVVRAGSISDFKDAIRSSDVLLIDDVQFLQNKAKTEEEFFHTFNAMHESGRQLVITCDRRPRELEALADRLLARFESGLVTAIDEPDSRLRRAIVRKRAQLDNVPLDCDDAISRIADRVPANIRSLEGALIRVSAYASMRRSAITADLVDELLDALHPRRDRPVTIAQVQNAVAGHYRLSLDQLVGPGRDRRLTTPRQLAMFLACELTDESLPAIAEAFGRNHSTIVHARDKLQKACNSGGDLAASVDTLKRIINGPGVTDTAA